jgi:hypothetical protein
LDWIICGKETGPGARPMNLDWARSLRDQCVAAGMPFFYKNGLLDGQPWQQFPETKARIIPGNVNNWGEGYNAGIHDAIEAVSTAEIGE